MESEIKPFNRTLVRAACAAFALATLVSSMTVFAQRDRDGYAIAVCQDALRERIVREQGGSNAKVNFERPQVTYDSYGMRCSGSGVYMHDFNDRGRRFTYDALVDLPGGDVSRVTYRFGGSGAGGNYDQGGNYDRGGNIDRGGNTDRAGNYNRGGNYDRSTGGGARPEGRTLYSGPIINLNSGKVLDVENPGSGTHRGSGVQQWDYANQSNQNWDVIDLGNNEVAIISQGSGMVLENAATIDQSPWRGGPNQRWRLEKRGGSFLITSSASGRCLDVVNQSRENGAKVQQYACNGQGNQQWRLGR